MQSSFSQILKCWRTNIPGPEQLLSGKRQEIWDNLATVPSSCVSKTVAVFSYFVATYIFNVLEKLSIWNNPVENPSEWWRILF